MDLHKIVLRTPGIIHVNGQSGGPPFKKDVILVFLITGEFTERRSFIYSYHTRTRIVKKVRNRAGSVYQ